jgi:hypothetical protein
MEFNIEVRVLQIGWEHEGWFRMDQRIIQRRAGVNSIMKY